MSEKYAWDGKGLDEVAAKELYLFIDNDSDLYRQQYEPILKNLTAKKARGVYDRNLAAKLFGYLVETGAKKYDKEFGAGGREWSQIFPKKLRDAVAEEFRDRFEIEYALGNYDTFTPKKYQKAKPAPHKARAKRRASPSVSLGGMR